MAKKMMKDTIDKGKKSNKQLGYPLPFGQNIADIERSYYEMGEKLSKKLSWVSLYEPIGNKNNFLSRTCAVSVGCLTLVSSACTPIRVEVEDAKSPTILIPFSGLCRSTLGQQEFVWNAKECGIFIPACPRGGISDNRSVLMYDIDPEKLIETGNCILGNDQDKIIDFELSNIRLLPLSFRGVDFKKFFYGICSLVDTLLSTQQGLDCSGIDDMIYRTTCFMMKPELFLNDVSVDRKVANRSKLDRCKEFIRENLTEPLTLTELEKVSGLSRRSLQYCFMKEILKKMQGGQRRRELERDLLEKAHEERSIKKNKLDAGFQNITFFSCYYKEHFGELPSVTLKAVRSRQCHSRLLFNQNEDGKGNV
ncbi:putative AraC family transcriptional regulator [Azospirillaceae bacterium]